MISPLPVEVAERIAEVNTRYTENDKIQEFHILHLYPKELAYPNGFYDSQFFNLVGFNTETMERRDLGQHDGIRYDLGVRPQLTRIFADGSTLLKFYSPVGVESFQEANIVPV
jgi:hypothetical protein